VLPLGLKDEVGYDTVEIFCPKCQCVYHPPPPPSKRGGAAAIDGASFGTTFAHLFLMTFSNLVPDPLTPDSTYVPRIFGFRVHSTARQRPATPPLPKGAIHNNNTAATNVVAVSTINEIATTTTPKTEIKSPQSQQSLGDNKDKWTTLSVVASTISNSAHNTINKSSSGLLLPEVLINKNGSRNSVGEEEEVAEINNGITSMQQQQQEDSDNLETFPQQTNKKRSRNATDAPENGGNNKLSLKQSKRKKNTNQL